MPAWWEQYVTEEDLGDWNKNRTNVSETLMALIDEASRKLEVV
jgi:hypothetical protein